MAYRSDPLEDEYLRRRIRDILHQKIQGGQYVGGKRVKKRKRMSKKKRADSMYFMQKGEKNPAKVKAGRVGAKHNKWLIFYKKWIKKNKNKYLGQAGSEMAKAAGKEYRSHYRKKR